MPKSRKTRAVTVIQNGKPVMTCLSIAEAQRQTGHFVTTIRDYAQTGRQTMDGYKYRLEDCR
ncbi:MAG: hypothetical protein EOM68_29040 [Spirochaetia bacterium]|nr:hypothetical protein [Spirochaetia bacterium]